MNNVTLAIAAALELTFAATGWAADATVASTAHKKSSAGTYTGCLAKGAGANEFMLTNVNGGSEEYELIGGKGLSDHVGHKVEVKGKEISAAQAEKAEKASGATETAGEAAHEHLRVSSMRHISETCP